MAQNRGSTAAAGKDECLPDRAIGQAEGASYGPEATCNATGRIGPWGIVTRAIAGAGSVAWALAVPHHHPLLDLPLAGSRTWGSVAGIVLLPGLVTLAVALRGRSAPPLRLGHGAACLVTASVVLLAQFFPVAVLTWIGATLLLLAILGDSGCELLALPNLLLRRNDYLVCLPFSAVDAWESHRTRAR
jgi:hypothetical protein